MSNLLVSRIDERPDFPLLRVALEPGQKVFAEPGAMVTMTSGVKLSAGLRGGIGATIGRAFGGESLIMSTYAATESGEVTFAPPSLGDIQHLRLDGSGTVLVQRGAFGWHECDASQAHGQVEQCAAALLQRRQWFSGEVVDFQRALDALGVGRLQPRRGDGVDCGKARMHARPAVARGLELKRGTQRRIGLRQFGQALAQALEVQHGAAH